MLHQGTIEDELEPDRREGSEWEGSESLTQDIPDKKETAEEARVQGNGDTDAWECPLCTLRNKGLSLECDACRHAKPDLDDASLRLAAELQRTWGGMPATSPTGPTGALAGFRRSKPPRCAARPADIREHFAKKARR